MRLWPFIASAFLLTVVSCQRSVEYDHRFDFAKVSNLKKIHEEAIHHDSALLADFRYYDSILPGKSFSRANRDLAFQKAQAYYCKAVVEEVKTRQHVEAFSDYLDALWIMDGLTGKRQVFSFASGNPEYEHFTALIYGKLAWFFYTYDAWDVALECLEQSSDCFKNEDNPLGIAANYELMGDVMLAQGDRSGSLVYYKRSDSIHERLQIDNNYKNINSLFHRAIELYNAGESKVSSDLLFHALEMADNDRLKRQVRFSLGYIYFENRQYDSALYNYERSYPLLPRQNVKSFCRIIKAANVLGDSIKAAYYGDLLSEYYLQRVTQSGDRTRMVMMYESAKSDGMDVHQKDIFYFVMMILVVIIVIVIITNSVVNYSRARHHKHEIAVHEQIKASLEGEIEASKRMSRHKEEQIRALETKLQKVVSNPDFQKLPFDKKMDTLFEMPICKRVCMVKEANVKAGSSYPELVLSNNQMTKLVNAVDAVFPKFSVKIIKKYPRLKRFDVVYCCMYILGISEVQAAALTGKTYQAVWTRSLKLHEVFGDKSNLQLFLQDLLKNW